jgi:hypothetical protein
MRTISVNVFKYKELSKKAQEKVLEKYRDINTEDQEWYEFTLDEWKTKLAEKGFTEADIHFSGFWSQGDGACFDARIDVSRLAEAVYSGKDEGFFREVLQLFADNGPMVLARIEKNSYGYHYSHANTRYVTVDNEMGDAEEEVERILEASLTDVPPMLSKWEDGGDNDVCKGLVALRLKYQAQAYGLGTLLKKFEVDANELRKNLSNEIYRELEEEYDGLTSDESVIEALEANYYEFDEDGDKI